MSAGGFTTTKYEAEGGAIWRIRVQPETLDLQIGSGGGSIDNDPPTAGLSGNLPTVNVGGSRRRYGVHARGVRVRFTGTPPAGYKSGTSIFLPILQEDNFDAIPRGATGTYLGVAIEVVGKVAEAIV